MSSSPKTLRRRHWIDIAVMPPDIAVMPPCEFVTALVELAMVSAT
jgi:hypothetical protein